MGNYRYIHPAFKKEIYNISTRMKTSDTAKLLKVSVSTVNRLKVRVSSARCLEEAAGTWQKRTGRPRVLDVFDLAFLESCIERTPDLETPELQDLLLDNRHIQVAASTIERALRRRGFSRKQVTRIPLERNEELRAQYLIRITQQYSPDQLVFVDESGANRNTTKRRMAWAPIGQRARRRDYFVRGTKYSMLPAISLDGVLHLDIQDQSYTAHSNQFIDGLLDVMNPYLAKNSVVIMDNASIHKSEEVQEMIEARGMRIEYLPPYSPDFDPIEEGFSATKAWIRHNREYVLMEMQPFEDADPYSLLWRAVFESMTPDNIRGWYRDSGYVV